MLAKRCVNELFVNNNQIPEQRGGLVLSTITWWDIYTFVHRQMTEGANAGILTELPFGSFGGDFLFPDLQDSSVRRLSEIVAGSASFLTAWTRLA